MREAWRDIIRVDCLFLFFDQYAVRSEVRDGILMYAVLATNQLATFDLQLYMPDGCTVGASTVSGQRSQGFSSRARIW